MNIVIIGAGEVGRYIASLLAKEEHNVILIDKNGKKLAESSSNLDVAIRQGSGTDWHLLEDLLELNPDFLIALSNDDEANLVACSIAKHLGYGRTIARVKDTRYLDPIRLNFAQMFHVDYFIGPELLVAHEMLKYMVCPGSIIVENFAHGAVQLRTFVIPQKWRKADKPLKELQIPKGMIISLIRREVPDSRDPTAFTVKIIFPHGNDVILADDEVTIIGETEVVSEAHHFFGIDQQPVKSVVIVGGSLTALNLSRMLETRDVKVRLIEKKIERCNYLAERLPKCTIINHDGTDLDFLKAEKIGTADMFISATHSDEVNLLAALLGKEVGCERAMTMLSNTSYAPLLDRMGIDHTVSPRISAANHILAQILSGTALSLISLYDNQAEILEIKVTKEARIVGIPLSEVGPLLPKEFLIAMIEHRGRIMIASGSRIVSPGDSVIVITHPKHIKELEKIF